MSSSRSNSPLYPLNLPSLTRTLRSYVPSSIHIPIPSAAPSPPLVSRPVSFGRFSSDSQTELGLREPPRASKLVSQQEFERDYEREGETHRMASQLTTVKDLVTVTDVKSSAPCYQSLIRPVVMGVF